MRNTILIVDDSDINRGLLSSILEQDYTIVEAENGTQALEIIDRQADELTAILLDLIMPEMDGMHVLEVLNERKLMDSIPVLIISGDTSYEAEKKCFELGITDYITKPFNNVIVQKRVKNAAGLYKYKIQLEERVEEQTSVLRKAYQALKIQAEKLRKNNQQIIDMLGTVVEYRNLESGEHIKRVKGYTGILAECAMKEYPEYGLTEEKINTIVAASSLHDIGKITIPDSILLKPGRLTEDEYEYIKSHTIRGCELLDEIDQDWEPDYKKVSYEIMYNDEKNEPELYIKTQADEREPYHPELFFSTAQLNTVALSSFLSRALSLTGIPIGTIVIDDPVGHFDDMNILGFADLMRSIIEKSKKQIVITTHDETVYQIFRRKLPPEIYRSRFIDMTEE